MKSPLSRYYGGKGRMAPGIAAMIHNESWLTYTEAFCGGASVYFHLNKSDDKEYVLNDRDSRIINFWDVGRNRPDDLLALVNSRAVVSKELHDKARFYFAEAEGVAYGTQNVELAWSLWYLIRLSFSGMTHAKMIRNANGKNRTARTLLNKIETFADAIAHLQFAVIDHEDAIKVVQAYDSETTFHYLDPPYVGAEQSHYSGYTQADLDALLDALEAAKGKFILSHYDNSEITARAERCGWHIIRVETLCMVRVNSSAATKRTEILVCNFNPQGKLL